jgi:signal transduction histidine kinase
LAAIGFNRRGELVHRPNRIASVYHQPHSGHYYMFAVGDAPPVSSRSMWDFRFDLQRVAPGEARVRRIAGPAQQQLLLLTRGYRKQGQELTIAVAEDISAMEVDIRRYQLGSGVALLALLALLLVLQQRLVSRLFEHLEKVRNEVRAVARGDAGQLDEEVPSEVMPLVREVNRLLQLLGQRMQRSRNALGNLAHALKTPLNLLGQDLDELPPGELRNRLQHQAEQIRGLTERELRRSHLSGGGAPGQQFDAAAELPSLIQALRRMHGGKHLDIRSGTLPSQPLPLDRDDMLELLGNLLDNACKWARQVVLVDVEHPGGARIRVEDDGPGVADEVLQQLTDRGVRIDEQVAGHGLGLAIVKDVVRLYGGTLHFDRSPTLGGLRVQVDLPLPE